MYHHHNRRDTLLQQPQAPISTYTVSQEGCLTALYKDLFTVNVKIGVLCNSQTIRQSSLLPRMREHPLTGSGSLLSNFHLRWLPVRHRHSGPVPHY